MRVPVAGSVLLALAVAQAAARDDAPEAQCFQAREIRELLQVDAHTLNVRVGAGERYRLELADACPDALAGAEKPVLVARGGRICGRNEEVLRIGSRECAVAGLARIDAREFAEQAKDAHDATAATSLDPVQVRGRRAHGFRANSAYCFAMQHVRGWRADAEGMVVEVSPLRSGGHRQYRVELAESCPELSHSTHMRMQSGVGIGAICGHAGDRVVPMAEPLPSAPGVTPFDGNAIARHVAERGCRISRVYPVESPAS